MKYPTDFLFLFINTIQGILLMKCILGYVNTLGKGYLFILRIPPIIMNYCCVLCKITNFNSYDIQEYVKCIPRQISL